MGDDSKRNTGSSSGDDIGILMGTSAAAEDVTSHVDATGLKQARLWSRFLRVAGCQGCKALVICFVDDAISVEVQWREDGARCKALTVSLADAHFKAMGGERRVVGVPSAKEEDDGLVDGTGDTRALCRHEGHDEKVAAE